jgi:alkanesulfonate monooxygenase SsuD/methylene tetrahydromethanopterin reductase-like flavin-dependent oxidoreductase (luciferase family)
MPIDTTKYPDGLPGELSVPRAMPRVEDGVRLGLFLANHRNAHYITNAAGYTEPTYENVRQIAITGDQIGLSFLLPVARWKGVIGDGADLCPYGLETITLSAGLLEATERVAVLSTIHTEVFNPVVVAKMGATMDQIGGGGRWGLNVVAGWSKADFASMGLELRGAENRYEHATHWLKAIRQLWAEGTSSYSCEYFKLQDAECWPRPRQIGGPLVVNAGQSPTGMKFAVDNAHYLFTTSADADQFRYVTEELGGQHVGYIGRQHVVIGKTRQRAEEIAEAIVAGGDKKAAARLMAHGRTSVEEMVERLEQPDALRNFLLQQPVVGDPTEVAQQLAAWSAGASVDGICLSLFSQQEMLDLMDDAFMETLGNELNDRGKKLVLN